MFSFIITSCLPRRKSLELWRCDDEKDEDVRTNLVFILANPVPLTLTCKEREKASLLYHFLCPMLPYRVLVKVLAVPYYPLQAF